MIIKYHWYKARTMYPVLIISLGMINIDKIGTLLHKISYLHN